MKKWIDHIKLFWYFAINWNPLLAAFIIRHEIKGEKKYKLNTSAPVELPDLTITKGDIAKSSRYEAVNYFILEALLARIAELTTNKTFIDLGCGKGRAMTVAAHYGFTKVNGIDFAKEMCDDAEKNMQKLQLQFSQLKYKIVCSNVLDYDIQPEESVFFMFNPFNEETISSFLEKIHTSVLQHPRDIYFLYVSPRHIDSFFEFEYEVVYRKRKLKWLDGVILKKEVTTHNNHLN